MNPTKRLAGTLLAAALLAMPLTLVAQSEDDDQSDTAIGEDVAGKVVEKAAELPTSVKSAWEMGIEKATGLPTTFESGAAAAAKQFGASEAVTAIVSDAVSGAMVFFDSSSTASEEEDSPYLWEQQARQAKEAVQARQFYLDHQAELMQKPAQPTRNNRSQTRYAVAQSA